MPAGTWRRTKPAQAKFSLPHDGELQQKPINARFHGSEFQQEPTRQDEQRTGPEAGPEKMRGGGWPAEIKKNPNTDDPAEHDQNQRIKPGLAYQPHRGRNALAMLVKQLKSFNQPAPGFARPNHRQEIVRQNLAPRLQRFGH